jgi:hypothetical protein
LVPSLWGIGTGDGNVPAAHVTKRKIEIGPHSLTNPHVSGHVHRHSHRPHVSDPEAGADVHLILLWIRPSDWRKYCVEAVSVHVFAHLSNLQLGNSLWNQRGYRAAGIIAAERGALRNWFPVFIDWLPQRCNLLRKQRELPALNLPPKKRTIRRRLSHLPANYRAFLRQNAPCVIGHSTNPRSNENVFITTALGATRP